MKKNDPYAIIKTIVITEKATACSEHKQYVFVVDKRARKQDIKFAVEQSFEKKVKAVNVINRKGKKKRNRFGIGKKPDTKRAIVTLHERESSLEVI